MSTPASIALTRHAASIGAGEAFHELVWSRLWRWYHGGLDDAAFLAEMRGLLDALRREHVTADIGAKI